MKEKLFKWLFKKELQNIENSNEFYKRKTEKEFAAKIENMNESYDIVKRIFRHNPNHVIVGIEKNDNNEELFVVKEEKFDQINFFLYGPSYQAINSLPRLFAEITLDYDSLNINDDSLMLPIQRNIKIDDIQAVDKKVGNGSILLKYLLKQANAEGKYIDRIKGELSPVDQKDFKGLKKFYENHGFTVEMNKGETSGMFSQTLKDEREPAIVLDSVKNKLDLER